MAEDHARRENERRAAQRLVFDGLHPGVVDGSVGADLGGSDDTKVGGAAIQRLQVAFLTSLLLLLRFGLPRVTPDLRARPSL